MSDALLLPLIQIALLISLPNDPYIILGMIAVMCILPEPYFSFFKEYLSKRKHLRFKTLPRSELNDVVKRQSHALYLGHGFEFTPRHTQKLMRLLSREQEHTGSGYRHGIADIHNVKSLGNYQSIFQDLEDLASHTLIFGTTGAGKTRMLDLLASQAVMRHDTVIVIDPKGDQDLRDNLYKACLINRREGVFRQFDLSQTGSEQCSDFNVLGSFDSVTEISSRIASLMSAAGSGENFKSHALNALTSTLIALKLSFELDVKEKRKKSGSRQDPAPDDIRCDDDMKFKRQCRYGITLALIRDVLSDFDSFKKILIRYFEDVVKDSGDAELIKDYSSIPYKCRASVAPLKELYHTLLAKKIMKESNADLDLLFSTANLDKTFYGKVTAGILPKLNSLSAGDLKKALSPAMGISFDSIVTNNGVLYVSLRTLVDSETGSNLGKLMLADLCAVAGKIYKSGNTSLYSLRSDGRDSLQKRFAKEDSLNDAGHKKRICIFIDEASEILCESMVQLANKSRGAGFALTLVTQTIADFVKHGGSKADAEQIIANTNTLISMRVKDADTCDAVIKRMPRIYIEERSMVRSFSRLSDRYHISKTAKEREVSLIPSSALELLPDLEYVATLADGRVMKGLIPFLKDDARDAQSSSNRRKLKRGLAGGHDGDKNRTTALSFIEDLQDCLLILKQDLKSTGLYKYLMRLSEHFTRR